MRRVCITVDTEFPDRPCRDPLGALDQVLEILAARATPATFFVVGSWARANPDRTGAIHAAGHQIGNHSYSHCSLARMTEQGIVDDLTECRQALDELSIETRPCFRAPYGEMTSSAHVRTAVRRAGYEHVRWHANGEDWRPGVSPAEVADTALEQVKRRWPGTATVLFHSWPDAAPGALSLLLDRLYASRVEFVRVEQIRDSVWRRAAARWHGSR